MRRRMGRPGLAGTMARTAVIAGTATAVSGNVARNQHARAAAQQDAAAAQQQAMVDQAAAQAAAQLQATPVPAPAAAPAANDTIAQLQQLAEMHAQGLLNNDEFTAAKAKLLGT